MKLSPPWTSGSSSERWRGMGFLFVFFREENHKLKPSSFIKRTASFNLLYRAQSTIFICLLIVFATLLFFTLSTLPPAATTAAAARRLYAGAPTTHLRRFSAPPFAASSPSNMSRALQGMGTLYERGTRAMNGVVVAHAPESLSPTELKLFLRLFLWSGLAAKSDLVLLFPSRTVQLDNLILRERDSFLQLLTRYSSEGSLTNSAAGFDPTLFATASETERENGEPVWGRKNRGNRSEDGVTGSNCPSYGSVVAFDVDELDPENSLSGFLEHVPMSLRRWACYPMLLGRVRRNFKHVMLVDIKGILLLGDPLDRVRNHSPESVLLTELAQSSSGKHGKRNSEKAETGLRNSVDPGVIMGGSRGIRRLSNAMLTNIVRFSIEHKKKRNSVTESSVINHLVGSEYMVKDVNLILSAELPELSSLIGSGTKSSSHLFSKNYGVITRGNNCNFDVINSMVMKYLCSFPVDSTVYSDC